MAIFTSYPVNLITKSVIVDTSTDGKVEVKSETDNEKVQSSLEAKDAIRNVTRS